jgi:hypothetical protein
MKAAGNIVLSNIIAYHQEHLKYNYSFWFSSPLPLPAAVMAEWELNHDSSRQYRFEQYYRLSSGAS